MLSKTQTYSRVASIRLIASAGKISNNLPANEAILVLDGTGNLRSDAIAIVASDLATNMVGSDLALVLGKTHTYSRVESITSMMRAGKIRNGLPADEAILVLEGAGNLRSDAIAVIAPNLATNMVGSDLALVLGETQTYSRVASIRSIANAGKIKRGLTAQDVALVSAGLGSQTADALGILTPYLAH